MVTIFMFPNLISHNKLGDHVYFNMEDKSEYIRQFASFAKTASLDVEIYRAPSVDLTLPDAFVAR